MSLLERRRPPIERLHHDGLRIAASFEFFPPKTPELANGCAPPRISCIPDPEFVSVTFGAGGTTRERTVETVIELARRGFNTAAHLTCVGSSRDEIHELARVYRDAGISHVVALRGDWPDGVAAPGSMGVAHASDLVALLRECGFAEISVAAFPEGHPESDFSLRREIENLKRKAEPARPARSRSSCSTTPCTCASSTGQRRPGSRSRSFGILPITDLAACGGSAARRRSVPGGRDPLFEGLDDDLPGRELVAASLAAEQCGPDDTQRAPRALLHPKSRQPHPGHMSATSVGSRPEAARAADAEAEAGGQEADQRG